MQTVLTDAAKNWPTPDTQNDRDGEQRRSEANGAHAVSLHHAVAAWATPMEDDANNLTRDSGNRSSLVRDANLWATPETGHSPNGHGARGGKAGNGHQSGNSLPAQATTLDGPQSSPSTPSTRRQLNPVFVEMLMGWPPGWTSLAPLASDSQATE